MTQIMIISVATGAITGVTTGLLVSIVVLRRAHAAAISAPATDGSSFDADQLAQDWAESTGRPGFAPFLAQKLRTADQIRRRRTRRPATRRR